MIWSRVRQVNTLRSLLREYYPAALAVFGTAPLPLTRFRVLGPVVPTRSVGSVHA
jgi:hypothetical protein